MVNFLCKFGHFGRLADNAAPSGRHAADHLMKLLLHRFEVIGCLVAELFGEIICDQDVPGWNFCPGVIKKPGQKLIDTCRKFLDLISRQSDKIANLNLVNDNILPIQYLTKRIPPSKVFDRNVRVFFHTPATELLRLFSFLEDSGRACYLLSFGLVRGGHQAVI